eukprot:11730283-Heterocapsa_arctica.AAC.1
MRPPWGMEVPEQPTVIFHPTMTTLQECRVRKKVRRSAGGPAGSKGCQAVSGGSGKSGGLGKEAFSAGWLEAS